MSGIAGVLRAGGAPVDRGLLEAMVEVMAGRGPDARGIRVEGSAGLACALLRSTFESADEVQPEMLEDGGAWIVGDLRIDDRRRLLRELEAAGRRVRSRAPDAEIVLHAWEAWGEACLDRLLGDFAFALWDPGRRALFCARDPWGVKPFFYRWAGGELVFASALDAVRLHPAVSDALDDLAIADFLLFGHFRDAGSTAFADVRRLPPAHALLLRDGELRVWRYWTLPIEEPLEWKRSEAYAERTRELFWTAVEDRLRTHRVVVQMSGGLDSTAIAAAARDLLERRADPFDLSAHTHVFDRLVPDDERRYAELAARSLDMPVRWFAGDDHPPLAGIGDRPWPEPEDTLLNGVQGDEWRVLEERVTRVLLSGVGGDEAMRPPRSYLASAIRRGRLPGLLGEVAGHVRRHRRLPGLGIRTALRDLGSGRTPWPFPEWLDAALVERLDLRERWRAAERDGRRSDHPVHPEAYAILTSRLFAASLELRDPGRRNFPVECRFPFLDLRLVRFLLRVPVRYEWLRKGLLREALAGRLPEEIRRRPKTPLRADLLTTWLSSGRWSGLPRNERSPRLLSYVRDGSFPSLAQLDDSYILWSHFRVLSLNEWLLAQESVTQTFPKEARNEGC